MDSVVMQILAWALPSGFLSSVVTWLVTRRQRNNDFLASLQKSIDLLTEKYTETLNENVRLQADNAHLLANQKVMEEKIDALNKKIDQLTKQLKTQNEKSNSGNSPRSAPRRSRAASACSSKRRPPPFATRIGMRSSRRRRTRRRHAGSMRNRFRRSGRT